MGHRERTSARRRCIPQRWHGTGNDRGRGERPDYRSAVSSSGLLWVRDLGRFFTGVTAITEWVDTIRW